MHTQTHTHTHTHTHTYIYILLRSRVQSIVNHRNTRALVKMPQWKKNDGNLVPQA